MPARIDHFFVLMMENRSLDHMLGLMKADDYKIEGLSSGEYSNQNLQEQIVYATSGARPTGDLGHDPNHHFEDVMEQIYGTPNPAAGQQADMSGFVRNYQRKAGNAQEGANVMKCFAPNALPVLTTLAKFYGVCDHWFSSIPGPTLPNRLFVHSGTSRGRLDMAPEFYKGFYTIYEELAKHQVPSTIFWSDWSGTLSFSGLMANQKVFYTDYAEFSAICAGDAAEVPAYCFIEPRYSPGRLPTGDIAPASDQHPDNDVRDGEVLIRNVYNAIRQNDALWHSSLLLILYDEHGGLWDHVPPVPMASPDGISSLAPPFDFKLSGLRVPAVVVSPYIKPKSICSDVFDHTSVIATAMKLFTNAWPSDVFFERAKQAKTLDVLLDLTMQPRDEWPKFADPDYGGVAPQMNAAAAGGLMLSDLQAEMLEQAKNLNKSLPAKYQVKVPQGIHTSTEVAGTFMKAVGNAALAAHQVLK